MTLKTEAKLLEICDAFASGLSYRSSAKACGVSPRSLFQWLKLSTAGDEDFIVEYLGERMQFSQAMALARKALHMELRSNLERRSALGHDERVFFAGMPTWQPDPRVVGWSEDDREAYGFPRDGLLRDKNGACIQNVIHHEPPIAAALRVLEMSFGEEYTPSSNVNLINKDTGVQVAAPVSAKLVVPPKPERPQLEYRPDPVPRSGADTEAKEAEIENLLGPEPVAEDASRDDDDEPEPVAAAIDPGPVIKEPTPPKYAPGLNPLIDPVKSAALREDFMRKLPSNLNRKV
jgi:hypothetical protein